MRLAAIVCLLLAGCQLPAETTEVRTAAALPDSSQASPTPMNWRTIQLGDCCQMSVPRNATDVSGRQLVDSEAGARFQLEQRLITADLRTLPGLKLSGPREKVERNVEQVGIDGFQNRMTVILNEGPPARQLTVNVTCPERDCSLADQVLNSVRVRRIR